MTDIEKMQAELSDDLIGRNGDDRRAAALIDVFKLQMGSAFMPLIVKGSGDIGVKAIGNEITISDSL